MKIGFFSDAHGNPDGVILCLDFFRRSGVDNIFFLGDAIGYYPDSNEVVKLLVDSNCECLMGNHEAMLLNKKKYNNQYDNIYKLGEARDSLQENFLDLLASWLPLRILEIRDRKILMVHGSPWDPLNGYCYPDCEEQGFSALPFDYVVVAHTHRPFMKQIGTVKLVNIGSCSLPRDCGNLSSCAILDTSCNDFNIYRIRLDECKLIEKYADRVHPEVIDVLQRRMPYSSLIGKLVEER